MNYLASSASVTGIWSAVQAAIDLYEGPATTNVQGCANAAQAIVAAASSFGGAYGAVATGLAGSVVEAAAAYAAYQGNDSVSVPSQRLGREPAVEHLPRDRSDTMVPIKHCANVIQGQISSDHLFIKTHRKHPAVEEFSLLFKDNLLRLRTSFLRDNIR